VSIFYLKASNTFPLRIFRLPFWSAKKKKIRSSSRNPVYQETRSRMERGVQKKKVTGAVGVVNLPPGGAGVAGLPLLHGDVEQKRIRPPSRKPVLSLARSRKEKVTKTIESAGRRLVGAGVAGLLQPYGDVEQKRIRLPSRKPVLSLARSRREKVKKTIEFADRRLVGAGVADPVVDREPEGLHVPQEADPGAHRKLKRVPQRNRKPNRAQPSRHEKTSPRQRVPPVQRHLLDRRENPMKIGNPWKTYPGYMKWS
jgi:hypothetical protein